MGVVYAATLRTTRMQAVVAAIDAGGAAGSLEILTSGSTVLAQLPLSYPCGVVSGDTLTFGAISSDTSANTSGTAALARFKDSAGNIIISNLTVGVSGSNINLNSTSITSGQVVGITLAVLSHNTSGV